MEDVDVLSSPAPGLVGDMELENALQATGEDAEMAPETTTGADVDFADADADTAMEGYDGDDQGTVGEEVEMDEAALEGEGEGEEDEGVFEEPPPFRSPPRVQTRDEEHQSQALGHTSKGDNQTEHGEATDEDGEAGAGDQGPDEGPPEAGPSNSSKTDEHNKHQSQLGDQALASQNQDDATDDPNGREQEQTIEDRSRNVQRLTQQQRQDRSGSETTKQVNEVNIRQRTPPDEGIEVSTNQRNSGPEHPSEGGPIEQVNVVNVMSSDDDCASNTASGATLVRPRPAKHLIRAVSFGPSLTKYFHHFRGRESHSPGVQDPAQEEEAPSSAEAKDAAQASEKGKKPRLRAPPVLLTCDKTRYTLFCERDQADVEEGEAASAAAAVNGEAGDEDEFEDGGLLFPEPEDHGLYFNALESLCARFHQEFRHFTTEGQEMVLVFDELGVNVPEDNVYTRELSLYDLDRLHVGANLPGRLHLFIQTQPRLIRRFNILAGHVSKLLEDESYDESDETDPLHTAEIAEALGQEGAEGDGGGDEDGPSEAVASNKVVMNDQGAEVAEGDGAGASVKRVIVTGRAKEGNVPDDSSATPAANSPVAVPADKLAEVAEPVELADAGGAKPDTSTPSESLPNKSNSQSVDTTPPALSTRSHAAANPEGPTTRKRSSEEAKEGAGEPLAAEGSDEAAKKKAKVA